MDFEVERLEIPLNSDSSEDDELGLLGFSACDSASDSESDEYWLCSIPFQRLIMLSYGS